MTQTIVHTYELASENRAKITSVIMALCISMALYYGFNVYMTISRTVSIQNAEKTLSELYSSVGTMNAQYLKLSSSITPDKLADYGLTQGKVSQFISKAPTADKVAMLK